jgi:hypothetical protein
VAILSLDVVAMFSIGNDGTLTPVPGFTFPAFGAGAVAGLDINCTGNLLFAIEAISEREQEGSKRIERNSGRK